MKNFKLLFLLILVTNCSLPSLEDIELQGEYAVPLINSKISVTNLFETIKNLEVTVAPDGGLSLKYQAELASDDISELLPNIPSVGEIPIIDTVSSFTLSASENFIITKAIFSGDQMRFRYAHDKEEKLVITMRIPELSKDGEPFILEHTLDAKGNLPFTEFTEAIDLSGYTYESANNLLTFRYDARNPQGERIRLNFAAMSFNELIFSYGEGSYQRTEYLVQGDSLDVNLYEGWQSGTLTFEDPKLTFLISHSFGFPISLRINEVNVVTLSGEERKLDGEILSQEIELDFPSFTEMNEVKTTEIILDQNNSNIEQLFNENLDFVDYDITAVINPGGDLNTKGYATNSSFFKIDAQAELPLTVKVSSLKLTDTLEIQNLFPDQLSEAQFKIVSENSYPLLMEFDFIFLDKNDDVLERLFENEPLTIEPSQKKTRFLDLEPDVIDKIRSAKKIVINSKFNDSSLDTSPVILKSDQELDLRVGLKFKL